MLHMSITVTLDDGAPKSYPVGPRVQVDFEREYKLSMLSAFSSDPKMEHLYWLGWKASHAAGAVVKPFDQWLDDVQSVEPDMGGDAGPLDDAEPSTT